MPPQESNPDKSPQTTRPFYQPGPSPGQIYKSIKLEERDFTRGETRLVKPKVPRFVEYCRFANRYVKPDPKSRYPEAHQEAVDFLGWDLKAGEFNSAISFTIFAALGIAVLIGLLLVFVPFFQDCSGFDADGNKVCTTVSLYKGLVAFAESETTAYLYIFGPLILAALGVVYFVQRYPLEKAREEQVRALTYVPEIIGYMTMSMKLVPNLERAVEFAAEHGRGKIADDLKKTIWDVQLGFHNTLSEGLDVLAYRWGKFSDEFKRSLMMIRASVLEDSESKRYILLDKTVEEMLDSIRTKMENYARQLSQPSIMLFYLGVLLPLILIIILPIGSVFSGAPLARPDILIFVYNIVIPIAAFLYARSVVKNRPPTYEPPKIADNYPGLPPKNTIAIGKSNVSLVFVLALILVVGVSTTVFVSKYGIPADKNPDGSQNYMLEPDPSEAHVLELDSKPANYFESGGLLDQQLTGQFKDPVLRQSHLEIEKRRYFASGGRDTTAYKLVFGILITLTALFSVYLYFSSIAKRKVQLETMQMETEFRDSLYVLASRMGENKPVEEAMQHTRLFLPKTLVAERIYGRTVDNIHMLGMPLETAVFDHTFGSLKNIPSAIIKSAMKLLVDSVSLGVNVSARTLMSLSMQLTNQEKVTRMLSTLVREVTSMMHTMVIFIAPIVLGVTTSLQKVVMITLAQIVESNATSSATTA
ncbi:MAG: hypothetical protein Q7R47_04840, partial [Candidatus Diapherotrites archaeon]|nr:hypothetical protein [Candidatus Diapherotrites archaeon]